MSACVWLVETLFIAFKSGFSLVVSCFLFLVSLNLFFFFSSSSFDDGSKQLKHTCMLTIQYFSISLMEKDLMVDVCIIAVDIF